MLFHSLISISKKTLKQTAHLMKRIWNIISCEPFKNVIIENTTSHQLEFWLLTVGWCQCTKRNVSENHSGWSQARKYIHKNEKDDNLSAIFIFCFLHFAVLTVPFEFVLFLLNGSKIYPPTCAPLAYWLFWAG